MKERIYERLEASSYGTSVPSSKSSNSRAPDSSAITRFDGTDPDLDPVVDQTALADAGDDHPRRDVIGPEEVAVLRQEDQVGFIAQAAKDGLVGEPANGRR